MGTEPNPQVNTMSRKSTQILFTLHLTMWYNKHFSPLCLCSMRFQWKAALIGRCVEICRRRDEGFDICCLTTVVSVINKYKQNKCNLRVQNNPEVKLLYMFYLIDQDSVGASCLNKGFINYHTQINWLIVSNACVFVSHASYKTRLSFKVLRLIEWLS